MKLDAYVEAFLFARKVDGVTAKTLDWHSGSLRLFGEWLTEYGHSLDPDQWDGDLLKGYVAYLQSRTIRRGGKPGATLAGGTVTNYVQSLLAFCRWLFEEDYVKANPGAKVKKPKAPQLVKDVFTDDELKRMIETARGEKRNGLRNAAIILVLTDTGIRVAELCGIEADDILWNQSLVRVFGKGQKERIVPFGPGTSNAMRKYQIKGRGTHPGYFFLSEEERKLTTTGVSTILRRLGDRAGVEGVHPHKFRRTFATSFLRNGGDVLTLQRIMGHTTLAMTQRYLSMVNDDLSREHAKASPVNALLKRK